MLAVFRRHAILTVFTIVAIVLVLIGWWVRPDVELAPATRPEDSVMPAPDSGPGDDGAESRSTSTGDSGPCNIEREWLAVENFDDALETYRTQVEALGKFAEVAMVGSKNADEIVFAASFSEGRARLDQYSSAIDDGLRSPYLLWKAVISCIDHIKDGGKCPIDDWFEMLSTYDAENSEVWMQLAGYRFQQGDHRAGMAALERAANATGTNGYWSRDLEVYTNGLVASGAFDRYDALGYAFGLSASSLPSYKLHADTCIDTKMTDARRLDWCEQYARNALSRPTTLLSQSIAESILRFVHEARGETDAAAAIQAKKRQRNIDALNNVPREQARMIFLRQHPELMDVYVSEIETRGEEEAMLRHRQRIDEAGLDAFMTRCRNELAAYAEAVRST